jgi:hypothetical protein
MGILSSRKRDREKHDRRERERGVAIILFMSEAASFAISSSYPSRKGNRGWPEISWRLEAKALTLRESEPRNGRTTWADSPSPRDSIINYISGPPDLWPQTDLSNLNGKCPAPRPDCLATRDIPTPQRSALSRVTSHTCGHDTGTDLIEDLPGAGERGTAVHVPYCSESIARSATSDPLADYAAMPFPAPHRRAALTFSPRS